MKLIPIILIGAAAAISARGALPVQVTFTGSKAEHV